ncbi:unnamed protein product [Fraxinus pennsylvanica]|uniref:Uncharacterized protein n=1 Tax=Fraxinus pennsylvanica TaxID=56036 RepID=A0AAD2E2N3_9LAMI|nr:unnamed protein product [Fraxinus pennsylvanica]
MNDGISEEAAQAVYFRCSSKRVGSEGGVALSEALGGCENLKKLDLQDNMFGVEVGVKLSKALSKHEYLTEITGNDITAEAASSLAACISTKKAITELNLSENELNDEGNDELKDIFKESPEELEPLDENDPERGDDDNNREFGMMVKAMKMNWNPNSKILMSIKMNRGCSRTFYEILSLETRNLPKSMWFVVLN